jgi:hypothetical protein
VDNPEPSNTAKHLIGHIKMLYVIMNKDGFILFGPDKPFTESFTLAKEFLNDSEGYQSFICEFEDTHAPVLSFCGKLQAGAFEGTMAGVFKQLLFKVNRVIVPFEDLDVSLTISGTEYVT